MNRFAEAEAIGKDESFIRFLCGDDIVTLSKLKKKSHWQFLQSYRWHDPFYSHLIRVVLLNEPPGYFLDVGANQGLRSIDPLYLGWKVHAVEPNPEAIQFLKSIYLMNGCLQGSGLIIHKCCAGSSVGSTQLFIDLSSYLSQVSDCHDGAFVASDVIASEVDTIASIVESNDICVAKAIAKIDTEGFEVEVIKGMFNYRDQFKTMFVELNPRNIEDFLDITKNSKECWWIDNVNMRLVDMRSILPTRQVDVLVVNSLRETTISKLLSP